MIKEIRFYLVILIVFFCFSGIYAKPYRYKTAKKHYLELKHEKSVVAVCNKAGIPVRIVPVIYQGKRRLFVYFEDNANTENILAAVKLIGAKYLLPLLNDIVKYKIKNINYYMIIINIRDRKKLMSAYIFPHLAISFAAGRITKKMFLKRIEIKVNAY